MRCKWANDKEYACFSGKTILVAGGTGFIGKRAVEIFTDLGLKVYVITRKSIQDTDKVKYLQADLTDLQSLWKLGIEDRFDYSVYLAANIPLRGAKKEDYFDAKKSTFDPFMNFAEVFLPKCDKFVYASSIDVMGGCSTWEYTETAKIGNASPYGLAKYIGEFYVQSVCARLGVSYSILRFSQVYGPNEPVVRIIPIIKKALKEKETFTLITGGEERRRFLFVDDAVKSITNGLLYAENEIYNITGPDVISMKELIELIESTWGMKLDYVVKGEIKGEDNVPSIEKAYRGIRYIPDVSMREGMKIVYEEEKC